MWRFSNYRFKRKLVFLDQFLEFLEDLFDPVSILRSVLRSIVFAVLKIILRRYKGNLVDSWKRGTAFISLHILATITAFWHVGCNNSKIVDSSYGVYHRANLKSLTGTECLQGILIFKGMESAINFSFQDSNVEYRRIELQNYYNLFLSKFFRYVSFPLSTIISIIYYRCFVFSRRKELAFSALNKGSSSA